MKEEADDTLFGVVAADVSIANSGDGGHREVESCHIQLADWKILKLVRFYPVCRISFVICVIFVVPLFCYKNPETRDEMTDQQQNYKEKD